MSRFRAPDLRRIVDGRWLGTPPRGLGLDDFSIDTRTLRQGDVYIAIKGDRLDGHDFVSDAFSRGASMAIIERPDAPGSSSGPCLQVGSTRAALGKLAGAWRRHLESTRVIAVTGSCGKTTTRMLMEQVLASQMRGSASIKSFNNEIGVPLTVLGAKASDRFLVVEIGTNHPGEIARLAALCEPDIGVITMIGASHLEGFGDVDAVRAEKASLLRFLREGGTAVVPSEDEALDPYLRGVKTVIRFGEDDRALLRLTARGQDWFEVNGRQRFPLTLRGHHNARNALAAVAVARRMGLTDGAIAAALGEVRPEPMRQELRQHGGVTIVNDAYNANPDSMRAGLRTFFEETNGASRRFILLGDMRELGASAPALHESVLETLKELIAGTPARVALVGAQFAAARSSGRGPGTDLVVEDAADPALTRWLGELAEGDALFLKGSRGMRLERALQAWESETTCSTTSSS